jgi:hypothetical protein
VLRPTGPLIRCRAVSCGPWRRACVSWITRTPPPGNSMGVRSERSCGSHRGRPPGLWGHTAHGARSRRSPTEAVPPWCHVPRSNRGSTHRSPESGRPCGWQGLQVRTIWKGCRFRMGRGVCADAPTALAPDERELSGSPVGARPHTSVLRGFALAPRTLSPIVRSGSSPKPARDARARQARPGGGGVHGMGGRHRLGGPPLPGGPPRRRA